MKQFTASFAVPFFLAASLYAQQGQETSVEQSYLNESIEIQIMRHGAEASGRANKLETLDFIHDYLEAGNKNPAVLGILTMLSVQGTLNKERLVDDPAGNNYPDVRWRAVEYLGQFPKEDVAETLQYVLLNEDEPEVATAATISLAKTGSYETNSLIAIEKSFRKFDAGRPSDRFAIAVLDYYDAAPSPKPRYMADTIDYIRNSPNYDYRVRARANKLLKDFMANFFKGNK